MQAENYTFLDFRRRTDALAARLGITLNDLPERIGISRSSLFGGRSKSKSPISSKTWAKLELAEEAAGLKFSHYPKAIPLRSELRGDLVVRESSEYAPSGDSPEQLASFLRAEALHHLEMARKLNAAADLLDQSNRRK